MRRLAFVAALALAATAAGARPDCAYACTCAPLVAEQALAAADAAVVGTVLERRVSGGEATLVVSVERRLKGPLGERVEVATPADDATCGIGAQPGTRLGLFLRREGGGWRGDLCGQARPEALASLPAAAGGEEVADSFAEATAYVLAVLVAGAIGVFLLRRRFRPD
ncbi:MAG TPA: hypothetical protein VFO88_05790 [Gaiellaceae bacterium]|nr:hypothetical protein [Gaiellaceae bacterium]